MIQDIATAAISNLARAGRDAGTLPVFGSPPSPSPAPVLGFDEAAPADAEKPDRAQLEAALSQISQHFPSARTDLSFRIDNELNRMVVSVVDANDGSILMQFPSEVALRIARNLGDAPVHLIEQVA